MTKEKESQLSRLDEEIFAIQELLQEKGLSFGMDLSKYKLDEE
jgi:hypothetical protein